ncbi:HD-GYP domain-containing protein [Bacillus timonensis]|nr:HD-GYP domain-containing protein [Bacillus timonensis]
MLENLKDFSIFNPDSWKNPLYFGIGIFSLILGILLDNYIFTHLTLMLAYIPVTIMTGLLARSFYTLIIMSGVTTYLLFFKSEHIWTMEVTLSRWFSYFIISFTIWILVKNINKERNHMIQLTSTLAESIDARDSYTSFHSRNVAYYSSEIGEALRLSRVKCQNLYVGGLLHDIGKIGIAESILNKPSRLTEDEFEKIKEHPQKGYNILKHISSFKKSEILEMVLHHHERFDGKGYPYGLKGVNIPLVARIMAVADAFDAMTSKRVYRDKPELTHALNEISRGKNTQFDPMVADVFIELIENGKIKVKGLE